jgi:adenylylsulfate kinase-like enzyme
LSVEHLEEIANTLESIASTVGRGEVLVIVAGFTGCGKGAIAGEIEIALKLRGASNGVNGDAEKRMTAADWLTAIEMY